MLTGNGWMGTKWVEDESNNTICISSCVRAIMMLSSRPARGVPGRTLPEYLALAGVRLQP